MTNGKDGSNNEMHCEKNRKKIQMTKTGERTPSHS